MNPKLMNNNKYEGCQTEIGTHKLNNVARVRLEPKLMPDRDIKVVRIKNQIVYHKMNS